ncbi:MAG: hypothetical protein KGJ78_18740, partial [Alphaproteobacteria bacterium]|nr:hypothetical protein [Alphaproteobacteria bacterium]
MGSTLQGTGSGHTIRAQDDAQAFREAGARVGYRSRKSTLLFTGARRLCLLDQFAAAADVVADGGVEGAALAREAAMLQGVAVGEGCAAPIRDPVRR